MFNNQNRASRPWRTLVQVVEKPIVGLVLSFGLAAGAMALPSANSEPTDANPTPATDTLDSAPTSALSDGVYLYGQSPEPNQIGSEYLVFEVAAGQVIGGFYMPRSSFDCFYGNVEADKLALTVIDSYEQTRHPYDVALQSAGDVAQANGNTAVPLGLEGYHRIDTLSETDQQVLATCRADQVRGE
ncbi:MAG: hypothetical protein MUF72_02745 [Elainella sp. Prado103]|nr:hypothetical protein [Elainella sp. Prado103]